MQGSVPMQAHNVQKIDRLKNVSGAMLSFLVKARVAQPAFRCLRTLTLFSFCQLEPEVHPKKRSRVPDTNFIYMLPR